MFSKINSSIRDLLVLALFMLPGVFAASEVNAKEGNSKAVSHPIQIIGKTTDGKFNIYKLKGAIDAERWTANGRTYDGADLAVRIPFLKKSDMPGLTCAFVCKDSKQNVVGLNPNFAWLYAK
jgi:hypothetical protein